MELFVEAKLIRGCHCGDGCVAEVGVVQHHPIGGTCQYDLVHCKLDSGHDKA